MLRVVMLIVVVDEHLVVRAGVRVFLERRMRDATVSDAETVDASEIPGLLYAGTLMAGLALLFGILCLVYWTVPNERMPWRAVWLGALAATLIIGLVDYAFSAYLLNVFTIGQFGTIFVFVLIVLLWFYALAMIIFLGAVLNAYCANLSGGIEEP